MSKSNLAEEFLFEEKITEEEFSNLQLNDDINDFCNINEVNKKKYLTLLKSNILQYSKIPQRNDIRISQNYIINKIILHDVPEANYLLKINGINAATFKKINKNDKYYNYCVDIKNVSNNVIDEHKTHCKYETHIDLTKIDNFSISYPKNTNFKYEFIYYSLYGIKFDEMNNKYEKMNTKYKYFLNTINLNFFHPTYFIDLLSKTQETNKQGNIYVYIDGIMVKNIIVNNNNFDIQRINFNNIEKIINKKCGKQDEYLSSEMSLKTINLSHVNNLQIAFSDVIIDNITQFYFTTYSLPHMTKLFCD